MAVIEGSSACGAGSEKPACARQSDDRERDFVAHPDGRAMARRAGKVRQVDDGLSALPTMERGGRLGGCRLDARPGDGRQQTSQRRFNDRSGPCLGSRRKRGTREQAFGRSRGGFTCKVHCLSDAKGTPLAFHLTPGEAADCAAFEDIYALQDVKPAYLLADKGYDTNAVRDRIKADGVRATIPSKSNRKKPIRWSKTIYRERNRIERMIGHLKINRAVATRYDKLARSFLDALHIAAIRKCLRMATL